MDWIKSLFGTKQKEDVEIEVFDGFNFTSQEKAEKIVYKQLAREDEQMKDIQEERQAKESAVEGQLLVINGAKIKMNGHVGTFNVLQNVPTTQEKPTGTTVEKQIPNFTFDDGFQLLSIDGDWQKVGSLMVQENLVLIKDSTISVSGKMPGNAPVEKGMITFTDSGQINEPEGIDIKEGAPVPMEEMTVEEVNGYFYNVNGKFETRIVGLRNGKDTDVYVCYGPEGDFSIKIKKLSVSHDDFCWIAGIVKLESSENDYEELRCICNTAANRAINKNVSLRVLLVNGQPLKNGKYIPYSTVPKNKKKQLEDTEVTSYANNTRKALIDVLLGNDDNSYGAELWDGDDFLAWGLNEINPWNKIGHAKFREYAFIKIPKDIYEKYKNSIIRKYGSYILFGDEGNHSKLDKTIESGQKHIHVTNSKGSKKIKYTLPESVFLNKQYWREDCFYYETKVRGVKEGITATNTFAQTIFWKIEKI